MKKKNILKFIFVLILLLLPTKIMARVSYGSDIYTGGGIPLVYDPRATTWWPGYGPQGIRITLVNGTTGIKIPNTKSVDFSNYYREVKNYQFFGHKGKTEYTGTNIELKRSNLIKGGYTVHKPIGSLPTFISTKKLSSNVVSNYIENNFDPLKQTGQLVQLLKMLGLSESHEVITNLKESLKCKLNNDCQSKFANLSSRYNYVILVEPVIYFAIDRGKYFVAATPEEISRFLPATRASAGFVGGITHNNGPKSIYVSKAWFSGSKRIEAASTSLVNSTRYLNLVNDVKNNKGIGVGVYYIFDEYTPPPPPPPSCVPKPTCSDGNCALEQSPIYKDEENWDCIKDSNTMKDATKGSSITVGGKQLCPVFCRQEVTTSFPKTVTEIVKGTTINFEPISITTTKECRSDIALSQWKTEYDSKRAAMVTAFNNWQKAIAKNNVWNSIVRTGSTHPNVTETTACGQTIVEDQIKINGTTSCGAVSGGSVFSKTLSRDDSNIRQQADYRIPIYLKWVRGLPKSGTPRAYGETCYLSERSDRVTLNNAVEIKGVEAIYYRSSSISNFSVRTFDLYKKPGLACSYYVGEEGTIDLAPYENVTEFVSKLDGTRYELTSDPTSTKKQCTLSTSKMVDNPERKYSWFYTYGGRTYTDGSPKCANSGNFSSEVAMYKEEYEDLRDEVGKLLTAIQTCSGWNMNLTTDPIVSIKQDELNSSGKVEKQNNYNLIITEKERLQTPGVGVCNGSGDLCNSNTTVTTCSVANGCESTKKVIPKYTSYAHQISETVSFGLPNNTNRYLLKPSGEAVSSLPSQYRNGGVLEGAYTEMKEPTYVVSFKENLIARGRMTLSYKNIGENGKFDSCINKTSTGFGTYTCPYEFKNTIEPVCLQEDCPDPICTENCAAPTLNNLIYRPIDLNVPFAGVTGATREPGFNWRFEPKKNYNDKNEAHVLVEKYITNNRGVTTEKVYDLEPMYVIDLTGVNKYLINEIRSYNRKNSYDDFNLSCTGTDADGKKNGTECRSTFLRKEIRTAVSGCGINGNWTACKGVVR